MSTSDKIAYAEMLAKSNFIPQEYKNQPANVLWAMSYAEALGVHHMTIITQVHIMQGKPTASSALISSLVRKAGHKLRVYIDTTQNTLTGVAELTRFDDPTYTYRTTWTLERARTAGVGGNATWKKYPEAMLKARATTEIARDAAADAILGLQYTPEELGAEVDAEENPINITASETPEPVAPQPKPAKKLTKDDFTITQDWEQAILIAMEDTDGEAFYNAQKLANTTEPRNEDLKTAFRYYWTELTPETQTKINNMYNTPTPS